LPNSEKVRKFWNSEKVRNFGKIFLEKAYHKVPSFGKIRKNLEKYGILEKNFGGKSITRCPVLEKSGEVWKSLGFWKIFL
jgi:hypothetical protein